MAHFALRSGDCVENSRTTVRRFVVERPVKQQVSLFDEKVVVERRKPVTDAETGATLTEVAVEMVETSEIPVVGSGSRSGKRWWSGVSARNEWKPFVTPSGATRLRSRAPSQRRVPIDGELQSPQAEDRPSY